MSPLMSLALGLGPDELIRKLETWAKIVPTGI